MDWLYLKGHGILVDIVFVLLCLSVVYYFYFRNTKQVVALVKETPTAIFLVGCQDGEIVDANRMARQLLSIRRVGKRYLAPSLITPKILLAMIDKAKSSPLQDWSISEHHKIRVHFTFSQSIVDSKKVWAVHATLPQPIANLSQESLLSLQAFNALSQLVFLKDVDGNLVSTNSAYQRFWAHREMEGCGMMLLDNIESGFSNKRWTTTPAGDSCLLETHVTPVKSEGGKIIGSIGISYDVSDWFYMQQSCSDEIAKRQTMELDLKKSETLLQSILTASPYPIALMNQQRVHEACNQAYADSLGIASPDQIIGHSLEELLPQHLIERFEESDREVLEKGNTLRFIDMVKNIHGEPVWWDVLKAPYTEPFTGNTGCLVIARDVTEHIAAEQKLAKAYSEIERLCYFDTQLHLPNQRYFDSQLQAVWRLHLRQESPLTVMICHLDNLDSYQQQYGDESAQEVLSLAASALEQAIQRGADLLAVNEQNEFIFLLPETQMPACQLVVDKIHAAIDKLNIEFRHREREIKMTASLGVSSAIPLRHFEPEIMVTLAYQALNEAKQAGGNQTQVRFLSQLESSHSERSSS
ncbi:diguanylate cyclase domain-containing protein [Vibrio gangliei]|uniref:diguanylate cyclase domain-containing protein n=1 Tax=Vibrio gangliei TaxID=2077090 RepID=UPI000D01399A|nr:diguanylate cyclase [Vibrio gangliei]